MTPSLSHGPRPVDEWKFVAGVKSRPVSPQIRQHESLFVFLADFLAYSRQTY